MHSCMRSFIQGAAEMDTPRVLSAASQLSLWFKAHMPDILTAVQQGQPIIAVPLCLTLILHSEPLSAVAWIVGRISCHVTD